MIQRAEYGYAVDWWSVGCLMYHLMVGRAPFDEDNSKFAVPTSLLGPTPRKKKKPKPKGVCSSTHTEIPCILGNPAQRKKDRICSEKVKLPSFLSPECHSLFKGLLHRDPTMRLGSSMCNHSSINKHSFFKGINWTKLENLEVCLTTLCTHASQSGLGFKSG